MISWTCVMGSAYSSSPREKTTSCLVVSLDMRSGLLNGCLRLIGREAARRECEFRGSLVPRPGGSGGAQARGQRDGAEAGDGEVGDGVAEAAGKRAAGGRAEHVADRPGAVHEAHRDGLGEAGAVGAVRDQGQTGREEGAVGDGGEDRE